MSCEKTSEVSEIVNQYGDKLPNPFNERFFFQAAHNARLRIIRLQRAKRKYWSYQLN
jgi:hypothetical protein